MPPEFKGEPKSNAALTTAITTAAGAIATGVLAAAAGATAAPVAGAILLGGAIAGFASNRMKQREPDVLVRSDGAQWIILRIPQGDVKHFNEGVDYLRQLAREQPNVLYLALRRTDVPSHPFLAEWQRSKDTEPFRSKWMQGAMLAPTGGSAGPSIFQALGEPPWMPVGRAARAHYAALNRRDRMKEPPLNEEERKELDEILAGIAREGNMDDLASVSR